MSTTSTRYGDRDYIQLENKKRAAIESMLELVGWNVIYRELMARGIDTLMIDSTHYSPIYLTLRPFHHPITPGWKLAVYDALGLE